VIDAPQLRQKATIRIDGIRFAPPIPRSKLGYTWTKGDYATGIGYLIVPPPHAEGFAVFLTAKT
jgi:hypothetical protein